MPHSTELPPGAIEAIINHIPALEDGEPERTLYPETVGYRRYKFEPHTEQVNDMRGREDEFQVDIHGFQLCKAAPIPQEVYSDDVKFRAMVYPEVKELLQKTTGASYVHVFGHIVRRDAHRAVLDIPQDTPDEEDCLLQTPAMIAHIDQSYHGAEQILGVIPEAPQLASKARTRWGIINVWRPFKPVTREPLAVCDARSVPESDLQQCWIHVVRSKDGENKALDVGLWYLQHGEGHKWYWPSEMQPDEALLIKCFDTKKDGRARRAPHSAIQTPTDRGSPRESVEVRCLVFWEDQEKE